MQIETKACRHGTLSYFADDMYVGKSLKLYGDYSEDEVSMFKKLLRPDDVCIEVGANIGALTIPMARLCKRVLAFEPQPDNYRLLCKNLDENEIYNVSAIPLAVGSAACEAKIATLEGLGCANYGCFEIGSGDITVRMTTLDLALQTSDEKIRFIKLDCEGSELEVLKGAERTLKRCNPILYVENDREDKSAQLVGWLIDHGNRCFWHKVPMFYEGNFNSEKTNVFGIIHSHMMICIPEAFNATVLNLEEVADFRVDPKMYDREYARTMKRLDKNPDDLHMRAIAAHYANLKGDYASAADHLHYGLQRDKDHQQCLQVKAMLDLQQGRYKEGWQGYEMRYAQPHPETFGWRPHYVPHWDGEPTDEVLLIWAEQGFGDSIMFGRFMEEVLLRAPNAILEIQPQLFELFELSRIVPQGKLFRLGRTLPEYTLHCALPSLPAVLRIESEAQMTRGKYLHSDPLLVDRWAKLHTPRIGICAKGGLASERSYSRDMPDHVREPLARKYGPFVSLENQGQYHNFAETAATIEALDVVLSVDTSVAHLAGALGAKTFLMLSSDPDFRWQRDRSDTFWYPSMTIFRQRSFLDWSTVVEEIDAALDEMREQKEAA